jgi:hypothetical protein
MNSNTDEISLFRNIRGHTFPLRYAFRVMVDSQASKFRVERTGDNTLDSSAWQ